LRKQQKKLISQKKLKFIFYWKIFGQMEFNQPAAKMEKSAKSTTPLPSRSLPSQLSAEPQWMILLYEYQA